MSNSADDSADKGWSIRQVTIVAMIAIALLGWALLAGAYDEAHRPELENRMVFLVGIAVLEVLSLLGGLGLAGMEQSLEGPFVKKKRGPGRRKNAPRNVPPQRLIDVLPRWGIAHVSYSLSRR